MKTVTSLYLTIMTLCLSGCAQYERVPGCTLDKLNLRGDVKKVETIVQTTMPVTEMFLEYANPTYAISSTSGNFVYEFDNNGNIIRHAGYGVNGDELFDTEYIFKDAISSTVPAPVIPSSYDTLGIDVNYKKDSQNRIVGAVYSQGGKPKWTMSMNYDSYNNATMITKDYNEMDVKIFDDTLRWIDTTFINYLSYDDEHNWTEAEVTYHGILRKFNNSYRVKRKITYSGDLGYGKLINQLKEYNEEANIKPFPCSFKRINIENDATIEIPDFMKTSVNQTNPVDYGMPEGTEYKLLRFRYNDPDIYSSVSIYDGEGVGNFSILLDPSVTYIDDETDNALKEEASNQMKIVKWMHSSIEEISGNKALVYKYYRLDPGNPIPVYSENYLFSIGGVKVLNILYSCQSNMKTQFEESFQKSIESIVIN